MRENGYSEEFIQMTGECSKRQLYDYKAVFESDMAVTEDGIMPMLDLGQDWEGFTGKLTVSHISYKDNVSEKQLSFNWAWNKEMPVFQDATSIYWGDSFTALPDTAWLQFCSDGIRTEYKTTHPSITVPKNLVSASFYVYRGTDAITQYEPNIGIATRFRISDEKTIRMNYASGSYGVYKFDIGNYTGTYSIIIVKANSNPDYNGYNSAVANYFRWTTYTNWDASFSIGYPSGVSLNLDPKYEYVYEKSTDKPVVFRYKS